MKVAFPQSASGDFSLSTYEGTIQRLLGCDHFIPDSFQDSESIVPSERDRALSFC